MSISSKNNKFLIVALFILSPFVANATVVEIRTSLGIIEVNLFDNTTPETVSNFLSYVSSGEYANSIIHRSVSSPNIIQGGGFVFSNDTASGGVLLDSVSTEDRPFVVNEPKLSNVRGTIAMAKGQDPDSAKSQWFINVGNNTQSLDVANNAGGFTVFGQVIGDGMQVVDAISELSTFRYASPFASIPLRNYNSSDFDNEVVLTDNNLMIITDVFIPDPTVVTNPDLNPTVNTLINAPSVGNNSGGDSGGAVGWLLLIGLVFLGKKAASRM
jgi:peptidyl-prolyl cis-trans isomerase A (cyclophilin A)